MTLSLFSSSPITNELPVVHADQSTVLSDTVSLYDRNGERVLLDDTHTVSFTAVTRIGNTTPTVSSAATVSSGGDAVLSIAAASLADAGIFQAELTVLNDAEECIYRFPCYLNVEPSAAASTTRERISVRSVRRDVRDRMAEDNETLDELEFLDGEICAAVYRCTDYYNSLPPTTMQKYYPSTFPEPSMLYPGVAGLLMQSHSFKLLRNRLPVQGTGATADMHARGEVYHQLAAALQDEFRQSAAVYKHHRNQRNGWGSQYWT
jgi:hypothetical protein